MNSHLPYSLEENDLLRLFNWHHLNAEGSRCELVSPGNYTVRNQSHGFLTAPLGSAVGLALYDRSAGVGGVACYLMPGPSASGSVRNPEQFVESGFPLFISELELAGADLQALEAAVAGGSLQLKDAEGHDCSRCEETADSLLDQLRRHRIPVATMELGGLKPLSLLLDTQSWAASIELMEDPLPPSVSKIRPPGPDQLDAAIDGVRPIPQVALSILSLLETAGDLSSILEQVRLDQVIAAKVLRFCNSPLYNPGREITSLDRALVFLGENSLAEIAISAAVSSSYDQACQGYALMKGGLFRHALAVAQVARALASWTGLVVPGVAYSAGLLHDIGKVVLDHFVAESLPFFYQHSADARKDYTELEQELFDIDHPEAGLRLAKKWNLSTPLRQTIAHHHYPERAEAECQVLVHLVYLADLLSTCYLPGVEIESINTIDFRNRLQILGLQPESLSAIIEKLPWGKLLYVP